MSKVNVRYIVNDVDRAIPFYTEILGFQARDASGAGLRKLVARRFAIVAQPTRRRRGRTSHARMVRFLLRAAGTASRLS